MVSKIEDLAEMLGIEETEEVAEMVGTDPEVAPV